MAQNKCIEFNSLDFYDDETNTLVFQLICLRCLGPWIRHAVYILTFKIDFVLFCYMNEQIIRWSVVF